MFTSHSYAVVSDRSANPPNRRSDIGRRKRANGGSKRKLLLLGRVRELALYREAYLRAQGFDVTALTDIAEAFDLITTQHFDAVIFSYTLPNEAVLHLSELVRELRPSCAVVAINSSPRLDPRVSPDEIAIADDGPEALLAALRRVLKGIQ
jgi:DNA-binding response OmpR family regulator